MSEAVEKKVVMVGEQRTPEERSALVKRLETLKPGRGSEKLLEGILEAVRHGPYIWEEYMKLTASRDSFKKTGKLVGVAWMNGAREGDDFAWLTDDHLRDCDLCPVKVPADKLKTYIEDGDEYEVCEECYRKFGPKHGQEEKVDP